MTPPEEPSPFLRSPYPKLWITDSFYGRESYCGRGGAWYGEFKGMVPKKVYHAPVEGPTPRSIRAAQIGGLVKEEKKRGPKARA